ncbi:MAG TPA: YtxH domain-containing protein [Thermodesulfobacteriota bacterium]|nr:YtxH domain-containing protein [Thermodesulfobacteriota bacterium]
MANEENGGSSFIGGLIIGSILGILAGILFAPKAGREIRSDLLKRGKETMDQAQKQMEEMERKGKEVYEQARSKFGKEGQV